MTVSWSNNSHPTGVIIPVYGFPTFPLTAKGVQSKGQSANSANSSTNPIFISSANPILRLLSRLRAMKLVFQMQTLVYMDKPS